MAPASIAVVVRVVGASGLILAMGLEWVLERACGTRRRPTGHPPVVIIAGSPTPPPSAVAFCDRCVREYRLRPGVSLAEDLINAWRTARGLPERGLSRP